MLSKMKDQIENTKVEENGQNLTNIFDYLTEHTGMTVKNLTTILNLFNLLHAQASINSIIL